MRDAKERLRDILDCIAKIERYQHLSQLELEANELVQVWFLRHLQIIGEASRALPPSIREASVEIPWSKIIGMRNVLVHDYFKIDLNTLWDTMQVDIPKLKPKIISLLKQLEEVDPGQT
jgi:Uncharacterized conserved protein